MLGGTLVEGAGETEPNEEEFEGVWQRARVFFGYEKNTDLSF